MFESAGAIFLRDRGTGAVTRIDTTAAGDANDASGWPAISADGSTVAFVSRASNLVPGDTNGSTDVFVRVVATGAIERVSVRSDGAQATSDPIYDPETSPVSLSGDGRYVAFATALPLVAADATATTSDIYVRDRVDHVTSRESCAAGGSTADGGSGEPAISADGRYVAFSTTAKNIVPTGTETGGVVVVRDRANGSIRLGSADADGVARQGYGASLSQDGRYLAFITQEPFVPDSVTTRIHERDLTTGAVYLAGPDEGLYGDSKFFVPPQRTDISADGRFVHWSLVDVSPYPGGDDGVRVFDRLYGITTTLLQDARISLPDGSAGSAMSADGLHFAASSFSGDLYLIDRSGDRAPIAVAHDLTVTADRDTPAFARISPPRVWSGTIDPDSDPLVITMSPLGPFPIGSTTITVSAYVGLAMSQATVRVLVTADPAPASPVQFTTARVNVDSAGERSFAYAADPWPSRDGRLIAFSSAHLAPDPGNSSLGGGDIYFRDLGAATTTSLGETLDYDEGVAKPRLSDDGRYVVFDRYVQTGSNAMLLDRSTGTFAGLDYRQVSSIGAISRNGRFILYGGDVHQGMSLLDQATRTAVDLPQLPLPEGSFDAALSDDGRYVAFTAAPANG